MDDDSWQGQNLASILSNDMTHIGIACNCHPVFEQFCVVEIGQDVEEIENTVTHVYYEGIDTDHSHPSDLTLEEEIPEFSLPGAIGCPNN